MAIHTGHNLSIKKTMTRRPHSVHFLHHSTLWGHTNRIHGKYIAPVSSEQTISYCKSCDANMSKKYLAIQNYIS